MIDLFYNGGPPEAAKKTNASFEKPPEKIRFS